MFRIETRADRINLSFRVVDMLAYLGVAMLAVGTLVALIMFRSIDDNSLVPWSWVFEQVDYVSVPAAGGLTAVALLASRLRFRERHFGLLLFLASYAAGMLFWGVPEVIVDAARYFTYAKHFETYGVAYFLSEWGRAMPVWTDLPLIPLAYGMLFALFGETRMVIQAFTTLLASATVFLTYRIGATVWDESIGRTGGLLMLAMPYLYTQVPLMLVDVPSMFLVTLAVYLFILALERGGTSIVPASFAICAASLSKFSSWPVLSVAAVITAVFLVVGRDESGALAPARLTPAERREVLGRAAAVVIIAAVLVAPVILLKYDVFAAQLQLLGEYQRPGLRRWGESHISTFLFQIHPFVSLAALVSVYAALKKRDACYAVVAWMVVLMLAMGVERVRYLMVVFPMIALMGSYGLQLIKNENLRRYIALCAVAISLAVAVLAYIPFLNRISAVNLKHAAEYLNSSGTRYVRVITASTTGFSEINPAVAVPVLDLFLERDIEYHFDHKPPSNETLATSSLRFTWEYGNPGYYGATVGGPGSSTARDEAVVVIAGEGDATPQQGIGEVLRGYRAVRRFSSGVERFRYQTVVTVYEPAAPPHLALP